MTDDDRMPASFVWTGDDGPEDQQQVPTGPALGTYSGTGFTDHRWMQPSIAVIPDRRQTIGMKLARFLNDLAEKVRGIH